MNMDAYAQAMRSMMDVCPICTMHYPKGTEHNECDPELLLWLKEDNESSEAQS